MALILENGKRLEDMVVNIRVGQPTEFNMDKSFISMIPLEQEKSLEISRSTLDFKVVSDEKVFFNLTKTKNSTTAIINNVEKKLQDTIQLLNI